MVYAHFIYSVIKPIQQRRYHRNRLVVIVNDIIVRRWNSREDENTRIDVCFFFFLLIILSPSRMRSGAYKRKRVLPYVRQWFARRQQLNHRPWVYKLDNRSFSDTHPWRVFSEPVHSLCLPKTFVKIQTGNCTYRNRLSKLCKIYVCCSLFCAPL